MEENQFEEILGFIAPPRKLFLVYFPPPLFECSEWLPRVASWEFKTEQRICLRFPWHQNDIAFQLRSARADETIVMLTYLSKNIFKISALSLASRYIPVHITMSKRRICDNCVDRSNAIISWPCVIGFCFSNKITHSLIRPSAKHVQQESQHEAKAEKKQEKQLFLVVDSVKCGLVISSFFSTLQSRVSIPKKRFSLSLRTPIKIWLLRYLTFCMSSDSHHPFHLRNPVKKQIRILVISVFGGNSLHNFQVNENQSKIKRLSARE